MKEGDKVTILYARYLTRDEQLLLKELKNTVTVEDIDYIGDKLMGFYSIEFPGYLFTADEVENELIFDIIE